MPDTHVLAERPRESQGQGQLAVYDAIVIGAGISGMYMLYRLRELGMTARVFEAGTNVGIPCSATSKPGSSALITGVSAKHLPRYLREWSYRFNRRNLPDGLDGYLIRRAVECATVTYDQLKAGTLPDGAERIRRLPAAVAQPALAG